MKKILPFAIVTKRIKYLGINLPKKMKDLYTENYSYCWKKLTTQRNGKIFHVHVLDIQALSGKSSTTVNITEWFAWLQYNLSAKESGLEWACVNNDDFTVVVSGSGRWLWVSMCTVCGHCIQNDLVSGATNLH